MTTLDHPSQVSHPSERESKLAEEILETQKSRSDMLKWKLVLVAALGAMGLGLSQEMKVAPLVLAIIPFVCVYVDLLCCNCNVRTILIGTYYATCCRDPYEGFVARHRSAFDMEDWALFGSTGLLCALVGIVGLFLTMAPPPSPTEQQSGAPPHGAAQRVADPPSAEALGAVPPRDDAGRAGPRHWFTQRWRRQGVVLMGAGLVGALLSQLTKRACSSRVQLQTKQREILGKQDLLDFLQSEYTQEEVMTLWRSLAHKGTFTFRPLANGLYPAAAPAHAGDDSGYQYVWVRDNVHIAHAHYAWGEKNQAARTLSTLLAYFEKYRHRFDNIIEGKANASDPMSRPHVRFDGQELAEIDQKWPHAQNDALGYFLWCYSKLARDNNSPVLCGARELECLAQFPSYFEAIRYWEDPDSGHWEETRKVSASSIGTVLAGLREFELLAEENPRWSDVILEGCRVTRQGLRDLQDNGRSALRRILTCECTQCDCYRRYDSALLFLIYPLEVLSGDEAERILGDVTTCLEGDHGIRRYLGDSYWCPDYTEKLGPEARTGDFSENIQARDALLRPGEEAQWCIFDPIISVIYGRRYLELKQRRDKRATEFLLLQTEYLNRALRQLTDEKSDLPGFRCPEAYYLRKGQYVPNDQTPLLWTQANLWLAIKQMQQSTRHKHRDAGKDRTASAIYNSLSRQNPPVEENGSEHISVAATDPP